MATDTNVHNANLHLNGNLTFASTSTATLPNQTVTNATVSASAAIAASKQQHEVYQCVGQAGAIAAGTFPLHLVLGATFTARKFYAGSVAPASSGSCTIDLKKNGTTVLSAVITLDSGNSAYVGEAASSISTPAAVAGDVYTVVVANSSWNGTGLYWHFVGDEDYAA